MAFKSVKKVEPHWYIPEDQQDIEAEDPLRFFVRALTTSEKSDINEQLSKAGKGTTNTFRDCFRAACTKIDGCEKPNGKPCTHPLAFLMLQDDQVFDYMIECGAYIFDISFDTDDEKKT